MLKRIENSCYCSQMTSPPLLKQVFQLFTITVRCNCGLAKKIVKATTNVQKIIDHLFKPALRAPLQGALDGSGSANKESFCFLVPAIDLELLHGVLPLQMGRYRFD